MIYPITTSADHAKEIHTDTLIDGNGDITEQEQIAALEAADEAASLLSLDDLSRNWCLHSLIENLPPAGMKTVMDLLRNQAAQESVPCV